MTMTVDSTAIGDCLYGTEVDIIDYSRLERDEFGDITVIERGYTDRVRYRARIETAQAATVRNLLASKRAVSAEYVGHADVDVTQVTGYLLNFSIELGPRYSHLTLEVEGELHEVS